MKSMAKNKITVFIRKPNTKNLNTKKIEGREKLGYVQKIAPATLVFNSN